MDPVGYVLLSAGRWTDIIMLIGTICNYVNEPKN
jgi:hypothetical protein